MPWSNAAREDLESNYIKFEPGERKTLKVLTDPVVVTSDTLKNDRTGEAVTAWQFDAEEGGHKKVWSVTSQRLKKMLMQTFPDGIAGMTISVKRIGEGTATAWDVEAVKAVA